MSERPALSDSYGWHTVNGLDMWGKPCSDLVFIRPKYFFWLGADAIPEPKVIASIGAA